MKGYLSVKHLGMYVKVKQKNHQANTIVTKFPGWQGRGMWYATCERFLHCQIENNPVYLGRCRRYRVEGRCLQPCFMWLWLTHVSTFYVKAFYFISGNLIYLKFSTEGSNLYSFQLKEKRFDNTMHVSKVFLHHRLVAYLVFQIK